ncbi:MAG: amidase [Alphaproteobacteria bacterium]|nr:amidase [Alphaproteobacteria bacterium]
MTDLTRLSLAAMADGLDAGSFSAVELLEAHLTVIGRANPALNAVWDLDADGARAAAVESDRRRAAGEARGSLDGIPIGLKDNIDVAGRPTTNGLGLAWTAEADAEIVARLRAEGAIPVAKLGMHEAALGATSDNPHHGRVEHPTAPGRTPGGSSGGSAVAVAAGMLPLTLGTDTLGSVRLPAAYCGVVGYKPSFDAIATDGVMPLCWTLDHVGPLARTVADIAFAAPALTGFEPEERPLQGLRLGWVAEADTVAIEPGVHGVIDATLARLRRAGVTIEAVDLGLGSLSALRRAALLIVEAEGAVALETIWADHPEALSDTLKGMLSYGRDAPSSRYVKAFRRVETAGAAVNAALESFDALLLPTVGHTAFPFDAAVPDDQADLTGLANMGGAPAITLPCGADGEGLPVGLQLIGGFYEDARLLGMALAVEKLLR